MIDILRIETMSTEFQLLFKVVEMVNLWLTISVAAAQIASNA
jgi:hypothetical protein